MSDGDDRYDEQLRDALDLGKGRYRMADDDTPPWLEPPVEPPDGPEDAPDEPDGMPDYDNALWSDGENTDG